MTNKIGVSKVYCILNIETNERYVGSTTNFSDRKAAHLYDLRHNRRKNERLQQAFDTYGEASLKFIILEEVQTFDKAVLIKREQYWIDKFKPEYNLNPIAGNYFNSNAYSQQAKDKRLAKIRGRIQPQSEKDKRAKSLKTYYGNPNNPRRTLSTKERKHLSKINSGKNNPNWGIKQSKETIEKKWEKLSKIAYTFRSPTGELHTIRGLQSSAESELGIPYGACRNLYRGITSSHKGWTFVESHKISD